MGKKRKLKSSNEDENEFDPVPKHLMVAHLKNQEKRLIIILEGAQLESVKVTFDPYKNRNQKAKNTNNILRIF